MAASRDGRGSFLRWTRRVAFVCVCLSIAYAASLAYAGVNTFTDIGPEGGLIDTIVYHPTDPSIAYLTSASGFYRSTNGGTTWELVSDRMLNGPRGIAVHPSRPSRVFVVAPGEGLWSSDDAGASLSYLSTFPVPYNLHGARAVTFNSDGSFVYALTGFRVFRSSDDGHSWQERASLPDSDTYPGVIYPDPSDPATLHVMSDSKGYRTSDGGNSWQAWNTQPLSAIHDVSVSRADPQRICVAAANGVWFSRDGGATWTATSPMGGYPLLVSPDPVDPQRLYAVSTSGLYKTFNGGASWTPIFGTEQSGIATTLARSPTNPMSLLLAGQAGVVGSGDGGASWSSRNSGIKATGVFELMPAPASDRIYIATLTAGIHFVAADAPVTTAANNSLLRTLAPFLDVHGLLVSADQQDRILAGVGTGIARSYDGGTSWQLLTNTGFNTDPVTKIVAVSHDEQSLLAASYRKLFRSTNGGDNWLELPAPAASMSGPMVAAPSAPSTVYLGVNPPSTDPAGEILKSEDAGSTWKPILSDLPNVLAIAVDPRTERTVYASASNKLRRTRDGGQSWSDVGWSGDGAWAIAIDPQDPEIIYTGNVLRIGRSVDAGETWESLPIPGRPLFWDVRALTVDPRRPHRLYVGTSQSSIHQISIEPDLSVELSNPADTVAYGRPTTLHYRVRNLGPFDATVVRTRVNLSASAVDAGVTTSAGSCSLANAIVMCEQRVLRVGSSTDIAITFTEPAVRAIHVAAAVEGAQPDVAPANNSAMSDLTVAEVADVSVSVGAPATVVEGSSISYAITVTNAGPNTARSVRATFQLANNLSAASVTASRGACNSDASGLATCTMDAIPASENAVITVVTTPRSNGTFTSNATVTAGGTDPSGSNNSAAATTVVTASATSTPPAKKGGGGSFTWRALGLLFALFSWRFARLNAASRLLTRSARHTSSQAP